MESSRSNLAGTGPVSNGSTARPAMRVGCCGHVLQREHRLDDRLAAQVTDRMQRLDQLLERQILMGIGVQRGGLHAVQHGAERGGAVETVRSASMLMKKRSGPRSRRGCVPQWGFRPPRRAGAPARQQHLEGGEQAA